MHKIPSNTEYYLHTRKFLHTLFQSFLTPLHPPATTLLTLFHHLRLVLTVVECYMNGISAVYTILCKAYLKDCN